MDSKRIENLLRELNQLEQKYGRVQTERDPNYDPSGEANARIETLKQELTQGGVRFSWDGSRYRLDKQ